MRIGVISDTHGLFDKSIASIFESVDVIVHAGDIGKLEVVDRLTSRWHVDRDPETGSASVTFARRLRPVDEIV